MPAGPATCRLCCRFRSATCPVARRGRAGPSAHPPSLAQPLSAPVDAGEDWATPETTAAKARAARSSSGRNDSPGGGEGNDRVPATGKIPQVAADMLTGSCSGSGYPARPQKPSDTGLAPGRAATTARLPDAYLSRTCARPAGSAAPSAPTRPGKPPARLVPPARSRRAVPAGWTPRCRNRARRRCACAAPPVRPAHALAATRRPSAATSAESPAARAATPGPRGAAGGAGRCASSSGWPPETTRNCAEAAGPAP